MKEPLYLFLVAIFASDFRISPVCLLIFDRSNANMSGTSWQDVAEVCPSIDWLLAEIMANPQA
jgi:hypothetical protein